MLVHINAQDVCVWGRTGSNSHLMNGEWIYRGTINGGPYYSLHIDASFTPNTQYLWRSGTSYYITDYAPGTLNIYRSKCMISTTDPISCGNNWRIGKETSNDINVFVQSAPCPHWDCDAITTGQTYASCDGPFNQIIGTNEYYSGQRYWYFHPSYFVWICGPSLDYSSSFSLYALTTDGWTDAVKGQSVVMDFVYPNNSSYKVTCDKYPTSSPTPAPTKNPTTIPTNIPTKTPSDNPSSTPTKYPSINPSHSPTKNPTASPSKYPSINPSQSPTKNPSTIPTKLPSNNPTITPTENPSVLPSESPSKSPSKNPSMNPSATPTQKPSNNPSYVPSRNPTYAPSYTPSGAPIASGHPSKAPSNPTVTPTQQPSFRPTKNPSNSPSKHPTLFPSLNPSSSPTLSSNNSILNTGYPSQPPTLSQTDIIYTTNIVIINQKDIRNDFITFNITNIDLSCGGDITSVQITDFFRYKNKWINYTFHNNEHYVFDNLTEIFQIPISIRITKTYMNETEMIEAVSVITTLEGGKKFNFESNFCVMMDDKDTTDYPEINATNYANHLYWKIDYIFYYVLAIIALLFGMIGIISKFKSICCSRNDYFRVGSIISAFMQILDMASDVFFAMNVYLHYSHYTLTKNNNDTFSFQLFLISILSVAFIVIPAIISLFQLHATSKKYWIRDNYVQEWLLMYNKLLYFTSILTASTFTAIDIFNSNLLGADLFYIGLNKKYLLSFTNKKLYSIILFENTPQLFLSMWYMIVLKRIDWIAIASMTFSCISIIVAIVSMILQKQIYKIQNYIYVSIDIKGKCIVDNMKICKNRMHKIKYYLCRSVLGINEKSVEIQKPISGSVVNGLKLKILISFMNDNDNGTNVGIYKQRIENAMFENSELINVIMNEWNLVSKPEIENVKCKYIESKRIRKMKERAFSDTDSRVTITETNITGII